MQAAFKRNLFFTFHIGKVVLLVLRIIREMSYLISFHIFLSSSDDLVFEDMDRFIEATVVISHGKNEVCLSNFVRKMYGIVRYVPYKGAKNESGVFSNEIELEDKGLDYSFVAGKTFNEK